VKKLAHVKKLAIALALCGSLLCSPVQAKTFVGVLWPMFGPLPAFGLMELVAELKMMPDVEVSTYLHQSWPSLVEDIDRQPPGTRTVVIGYSLGANASVFVANKAKYVDLIIALQPSMLSWNPPVTGKVGRMIEIYNPDPAMTFGGMGSKKLLGGHIEYIANDDSHPGAQFAPQFRNLVKNEVAKFGAEDRLETAQAAMPRPLQLARLERSPQQQAGQASGGATLARRQIAQIETPKPAQPAAVPKPVAPAATAVSAAPGKAAQRRQEHVAGEETAEDTTFLDVLTRSLHAGVLSSQPALTPDAMTDYARRTYGVAGSDAIAASFTRSSRSRAVN